MNLLKLKTLAQLRQFLDNTQALEFASLADTAACYAHVEQTIQHFSYASLCRADRSVVLRYLERTSGYSSAQVKRLVARALDGQALQLRYVTPTRPTPVALPSKPAAPCTARRRPAKNQSSHCVTSSAPLWVAFSWLQ